MVIPLGQWTRYPETIVSLCVPSIQARTILGWVADQSVQYMYLQQTPTFNWLRSIWRVHFIKYICIKWFFLKPIQQYILYFSKHYVHDFLDIKCNYKCLTKVTWDFTCQSCMAFINKNSKYSYTVLNKLSHSSFHVVLMFLLFLIILQCFKNSAL